MRAITSSLLPPFISLKTTRRTKVFGSDAEWLAAFYLEIEDAYHVMLLPRMVPPRDGLGRPITPSSISTSRYMASKQYFNGGCEQLKQ